MLKIILRSAIIALVISVTTNVISEWYVHLGDAEFKEYCLESGKSDPECAEYLLEQKLESEALGLSIALYIFSIVQIFIIIFIGCIFLGIWNYYYPIKQTT